MKGNRYKSIVIEADWKIMRHLLELTLYYYLEIHCQIVLGIYTYSSELCILANHI